MAQMSLRAYAKYKGIALATLQEKIQRGTIGKRCMVQTGDRTHPMIDSVLADEDLKNNTDPAKVAIQRSFQGKKRKPGPPPVEDEDPDGLGAAILAATKPPPVAKPETHTENIQGQEVEVTTHPPEHGEDRFGRYREAKTSTEQMRARKLELEVAEKEGRLLDVEDVRKAITRLVGEARSSLGNIPAKISPMAVSITDIVEMETLIQKEINDALTGLSKLEHQLGENDNEQRKHGSKSVGAPLASEAP